MPGIFLAEIKFYKKYKNGLKQTVTTVITLGLAIPEFVAILRQYVHPKEYVTVYLRNGYLL